MDRNPGRGRRRDPMVMRVRHLRNYIEALLAPDMEHLRTIRIGTKSLSYWPYRFLTDPDADELLDLFEQVTRAGKHLAIMAHFNHPNELQTEAVAEAVRRIRATGANIRTQSPILRHINDNADAWATMWRKQVSLGMVPYYMFMVRDTGATAVIVGHSERRADHGEVDRIVREKTSAAHRAGLTAIVCIGETRGQREAGLTLDVVRRQLSASLPESVTDTNTVLAYEPVWAIGTGLTPSNDDVAEVHSAIRQDLEARFGAAGSRIRILYGGSVKPSNAAELLSLPNVDGALVGGASLKAEDFLAIVRATA